MGNYAPLLLCTCKCLRCGNVWIARITNPKTCPLCGSPNWRTPRPNKYADRVVENQEKINRMFNGETFTKGW